MALVYTRPDPTIRRSGSYVVPTEKRVREVRETLPHAALSGQPTCHYCSSPAWGWVFDEEAARDRQWAPSASPDCGGYVVACVTHGGGC